jgi:hypothetical protein
MNHPIHKVISFHIAGPYTLRVKFEDDKEQTIDFSPLLFGELYEMLRDLSVFNQVQVDPEVHTLVWPNGADFDPAVLYDWPHYADEYTASMKQWQLIPREDSVR